MIKEEIKTGENEAYTTFGNMAPISNNAIKLYLYWKSNKTKILDLFDEQFLYFYQTVAYIAKQ